jgi:flagellar FliJ protein
MNLNVLQTLVDLAKKQSADAATALASEIAQEHDGMNKLSMLSEFRDDYRLKMQASMMAGTTVSELNNFNQFIHKLDAEIIQQELSNFFLSKQVEAARKKWQVCEKQLLTYETLIHRTQAKLQLIENRRDQKTTDEFAARRYIGRIL